MDLPQTPRNIIRNIQDLQSQGNKLCSQSYDGIVLGLLLVSFVRTLETFVSLVSAINGDRFIGSVHILGKPFVEDVLEFCPKM